MNLFEQIGYLLGKQYNLYLQGLVSTVVLSTVGTLVGLLIGIFLALGSTLKISSEHSRLSQWWKYIILFLCKLYSTVIRGTPMMVQAMIFKYGTQALGINWNLVFSKEPIFNGWFFAGLVVITFNTGAYMCEIVKSGLNGIDFGQIEGARSLGMTNGQTMANIVLPQAIKNSLPTIGNEWIVNIKDSSVLNVIGVAELYYRSGQASNKNYFIMASFVIIAVIYLCLTLVTNGILSIVNLKLDGRKINFGFLHFKKKEAN